MVQVTLGDSGDTFTIPAGATITNNGTQTGFGRNGAVDWQTSIKTSNFYCSKWRGLFYNFRKCNYNEFTSGSPGAIVAFQRLCTKF